MRREKGELWNSRRNAEDRARVLLQQRGYNTDQFRIQRVKTIGGGHGYEIYLPDPALTGAEEGNEK